MICRLNTIQASLVTSALLGVLIAFPGPSANAGPSEKAHSHSAKEGHAEAPGGHGDHGDHAMSGGMPGKASDVDRTVVVIAKDLEFDKKKIDVKAGETVRFVIRNKGELLHEFTIGAPEVQKEHQKEMLKMMDEGKFTATKMEPGMHHGHGNSAMIEPDKEAEVIWKFSKSGELKFGCNIPGHYESGMKGDFVVGGGS